MWFRRVVRRDRDRLGSSNSLDGVHLGGCERDGLEWVIDIITRFNPFFCNEDSGTPARLTSKEIDRDKRTINWPKPLLEPDHEETIAEIDDRIAVDEDEDENLDEDENEDEAELTSEELNQLLSQINTQLGERVLSRDISAANYAIAKRFVTGLANDNKAQ